jgi:hypothetical protein
MPAKKTEAEIIMAELVKMNERLAKKNLGHLEITDLTVKPRLINSDDPPCRDGYEPRMKKMPDGSFKLKCVRKL